MPNDSISLTHEMMRDNKLIEESLKEYYNEDCIGTTIFQNNALRDVKRVCHILLKNYANCTKGVENE